MCALYLWVVPTMKHQQYEDWLVKKKELERKIAHGEEYDEDELIQPGEEAEENLPVLGREEIAAVSPNVIFKSMNTKYYLFSVLASVVVMVTLNYLLTFKLILPPHEYNISSVSSVLLLTKISICAFIGYMLYMVFIMDSFDQITEDYVK